MGRTWELWVDRLAFVDALRFLKEEMESADRPCALHLWYQGGRLVLDAAGSDISLEASGTWPAQVRVASRDRGGLEGALASHPYARLRVEDGMLWFGVAGVPCRALTGRRAVPDLPLDPPFDEVLRWAATFDEELVDDTGVEREIRSVRSRILDILDHGMRSLGTEYPVAGVTRRFFAELLDPASRRYPPGGSPPSLT